MSWCLAVSHGRPSISLSGLMRVTLFSLYGGLTFGRTTYCEAHGGRVPGPLRCTVAVLHGELLDSRHYLAHSPGTASFPLQSGSRHFRICCNAWHHCASLAACVFSVRCECQPCIAMNTFLFPSKHCREWSLICIFTCMLISCDAGFAWLALLASYHLLTKLASYIYTTRAPADLRQARAFLACCSNICN